MAVNTWFIFTCFQLRHTAVYSILNINTIDEDIVIFYFQDLEGNVRKVAKFLNLELTQEQIDRVVTANTFENKKKEMGSNHPVYRKGETVGIQQSENSDYFCGSYGTPLLH